MEHDPRYKTVVVKKGDVEGKYYHVNGKKDHDHKVPVVPKQMKLIQSGKNLLYKPQKISKKLSITEYI